MVNKINVMHVITKLERGGAQLNTIFTVKNIDKNKFTVSLVSGQGGILTDEVVRCQSENCYKYFSLKSLKREISPIADFRTILKLRKIIRDLRPDIVHTHSSKAGIIGRIAAKISGTKCKTVHSVHGFPFSPNQSFLKRSVYFLIEKAGSYMTDRFIFVSKSDLKTAEKRGFVKKNKANYDLIRSGFDLMKFRNTRERRKNARERFGIDTGKTVVGVIAPFKVQKGIQDLIEIASLVVKNREAVIFLWLGDGSLRGVIESALNTKGIKQNFLLPGFIENIEDVIPAFDIGLSTALWEGLPQSIIQILLNNLPVVVSDIPAHHEIIHDGKNGFVTDTREHRSSAGILESLIDDPEMRRRLGQYHQDLSGWDGNNMVRKQERLYMKLI